MELPPSSSLLQSPPAPIASPSPPDGARSGLDWLRLLLEFAIVVVGISLSFFLQDLREEHAMRAEEDRFLASFASDLRADIELLKSREEVLVTMSAGLRAALDAEQRAKLGRPELDKIMDAGLTYLAFTPSMATYRELRQTGASKLIRDKQLLGEIIQLYETEYALAVEWDRINRDLVLGRMFPYVEEFGPGVAGIVDGNFIAGYHTVFLALEHEQWFRNLLSTNAAFKEAQQSVYGRLAEKVKDVLTLLD